MNIKMGSYRELSNKELRESGHIERLGHTFEKETTFGKVVTWEGRCPICGEWVTHDFGKDREQFIRDGRWDFKKKRLTHCAKNKLCSDWYYEHQRFLQRESANLFKKLLKQKLV